MIVRLEIRNYAPLCFKRDPGVVSANLSSAGNRHIRCAPRFQIRMTRRESIHSRRAEVSIKIL